MRIFDLIKQIKFISNSLVFSCYQNIKKRYFKCMLFFLLFVFSVPTLAQKLQFDEVLITLKVKDIGSTELSVLINEKEEIFLSVIEVFEFLKIKNQYNLNYTLVYGFFINQKNIFRIDKSTHTISYKGKKIPLKPEDLISTTSNLFLKASYFNSIFKLKNTFSFRRLSVSISSRLELPAIKEARLKRMRENINSIKKEITADTTFARDKPLFHLGAVDWSINTIQQTNGSSSERANLRMGGLLGGGDFTGILNYSANQSFLLRNQYYRWRYAALNNKYISEISLGKIAAPSTTTIFNSVVGARITNAPILNRKYFGSYALSDYTNPDWTVELYVNNVLVDYMKADANGFYSFDVPLMYGRTAVSVRYYGPWGEEQVSSKQFVIPFYFLQKNKLEYSLNSGIIEDDKNSIFANAKVNYGLSDYITLEGGLEYVSSTQNNKVIPYFGTSIRLANQLFISGNYYSKVKYTGSLNFSTPKNMKFNLDYTKYHKDQDAVRINFSEIRKIGISTRIQISKFSGFSRFTFQQSLTAATTFNISKLMLSGRLYGMRFNFTTNAYATNSTTPFIFSNLSTSLRLPKGIVIVPSIRYEYTARAFNFLQVGLKKKVFKKGFLQASFNLNVKNKRSSFQIGFRYNFKASNVGFSSNFSKNSTSFSQSASGSLILEPNQNFMKFTNRSSVGRASVKFIPFLDSNGNGKRDPNENPVNGLQVEMSGGKTHLNPKKGTTIITGLTPYIEKYLEFNTEGVDNIAWRLQHKTLKITLNPNELKIIEVPFSVVGEISGMVQYLTNGQLSGASGLKINIYKNNTVFVTSILSQSDGYFSYLGLTSGTYSARIDTTQLQKLQLRAETKSTEFKIENGTYGAFIDNIEFILYNEH